MKLHDPFLISSRLLPAIKVGDATISMDTEGYDDEGRLIYHYYIDHADFEYENTDLKSGVGGDDLVSGFTSLLSFLSHDAEHYRYLYLHHPVLLNKSEDESEDYCFDSPSVVEWAYQNSDEIDLLAFELEEAAKQGKVLIEY